MNISRQRDFLLRENIEQPLDEMAKITGGLKATIEAIMEENPDLDGLALKKVIKADEDIIELLRGEDLFDNQLNKFIATYKGQRILQTRGRKPKPTEDEASITEMAKLEGGLKSAIEKAINDNPDLDGLALKKVIRSNADVISALGEDSLHDNQLNRFISLSKGQRVNQTMGRKPKTEPSSNTPLEKQSLSSLLDDEPSEEENNEFDTDPTDSELDNSIKPEFTSNSSQANAYKNIIVKKVNRIEALPSNERGISVDMAALKSYIKKPEVQKALTSQVIRDLVSSIIG